MMAKVAELVDALALGASGVTRESSSLSFRTKQVVYRRKWRMCTSEATEEKKWKFL